MYPSDKAAGGLVSWSAPWSPAGAAPVVELEVSPHTFTRLLLISSDQAGEQDDGCEYHLDM